MENELNPARQPSALVVPEHIVEWDRQQREVSSKAYREKLEALRNEYRAAQQQIISPDTREALMRGFRGERRVLVKDNAQFSSGFSERLMRRKEARELADSLDVNWTALEQLNASMHAKLNALNFGPAREQRGQSIILNESSRLEIPTSALKPTDYGHGPYMTTYSPRYPLYWERPSVPDSWVSGDGTIKRNDSQLDPNYAAQGAVLWGQNYNAGDVDVVQVIRQNGYLVMFTPDRMGQLEIQFDLTCGQCIHYAWLYNEFGWSDAHISTFENAVAAVYPANSFDVALSEVNTYRFIHGTDFDSNGDWYPGKVTPALPNERRIAISYTNRAFPANMPLWIYVGLDQHVFAFLNDVSVNAWLTSQWFITAIRVRVI